MTSLLIAACTGGNAARPSEPGTPTSIAGSSGSDKPTAINGSTLTCWTSQTEGESGPIGFEESAEQLGLVDPLTGLHGHASAFGDVDGDDEPDLFVGTFGDRPPENYKVRGAEGPSTDQLLIASGGFESTNLLLEELGRTSGGLFADFDGDGDDDLLLIRHAGLKRQSDVPSRIYENVGGGELVSSELLPNSFLGRTPAVADFDGDGLLDIYVSEDKYGDTGGVLLLNKGKMVFEDVTNGSGLEGVFALGATAADLNDDSKPDLVTSRNIFMNLGDMTFLDITPAWFVDEPMGGEDDPAGVAIGDLNRDGIPDIVLGQHNRLTVETEAEDPVRVFAGLGPDTEGKPIFDEVTDEAVSPLPTLAPHVFIADLDNDGWPDIVTSASAADGTEPAILRNVGNGEMRFEMPGGLGSDQYWVGTPVVDLDRDGRLDIFALEWEPTLPSLMFINSGSTGHWLEVSISGPQRGVGSVITVSTTEGELLGVQEIGVGGGYASGQMPVAHFGLGNATEIDLTIQLPDGEVFALDGISSDQYLRWPDGC